MRGGRTAVSNVEDEALRAAMSRLLYLREGHRMLWDFLTESRWV